MKDIVHETCLEYCVEWKNVLIYSIENKFSIDIDIEAVPRGTPYMYIHFLNKTAYFSKIYVHILRSLVISYIITIVLNFRLVMEIAKIAIICV